MSEGKTKKQHHANSKPAKPGYRFERLVAWQKAMDFCTRAHEESCRFRKEEVHGLTSQLRRASVCIPLNIAEGCGCDTGKGLAQFLTVALRSQYEMVTILRLAERLGYLPKEISQQLEDESSEVGRLIQGLRKSLSENRRPRLARRGGSDD